MKIGIEVYTIGGRGGAIRHESTRRCCVCREACSAIEGIALLPSLSVGLSMPPRSCGDTRLGADAKKHSGAQDLHGEVRRGKAVDQVDGSG